MIFLLNHWTNFDQSIMPLQKFTEMRGHVSFQGGDCGVVLKTPPRPYKPIFSGWGMGCKLLISTKHDTKLFSDLSFRPRFSAYTTHLKAARVLHCVNPCCDGRSLFLRFRQNDPKLSHQKLKK